MRRSGLFSILFLFTTAAAAHPQSDDPRKLREELVKARLENLTLKLRLARLSPRSEDELKILEEALDADLPEVVAAAFRELIALPEDRRRGAMPAVLRRFPSGRDSFRIDAIGFLGRVPAPEAEATVLNSAADAAPAVRKAVAGALRTASHSGAAETLLLLFRDPDRDVRIAALDALGFGKREPAVAPLSAALAVEKDPLIVEKTVDAVEPCLPQLAILLEPGVGVAQRRRHEPARPALRVAPARDQPGALEHLEVLRDRGLAHRERFRELHHRRLAPGEPREDRAARRIGERGEGGVESSGLHGSEPPGSIT